MFEPIRTQRLVLRWTKPSDAQAFFERRNDPAVAEYQDWELPYPLERAEASMAALAEIDTPPNDEWCVLTVADHNDEEIFGDLVLKLENDGRTAEVGYTFAQEHWSKGFATEALSALIDWLLYTQGVSRVYAMLHPDNVRSARVLEQCGFEFEGHLRNSYWLGDLNEDDWLYGLTPELHRKWLDRPRYRPEKVELVELYPIGLRRVVELGVHQSQKRFVSPIAASLAQVAVPPLEQGFEGEPDGPRVVPWPRIIHADGEPVGFVMMEQPTEHNPEPYLWRLLIDRFHQRRGIGGEVLKMVAAQARSWGSESLLVSWMPGVGSPEGMYLAKGFVPTGKIIDGEIEARLQLR